MRPRKHKGQEKGESEVPLCHKCQPDTDNSIPHERRRLAPIATATLILQSVIAFDVVLLLDAEV